VPVTVKVNGTINSLVHKGSNHISAATIPDVCKTPSPGGPIPIPYPNVSQSATLDKGTTTVKADGGMMIATKGSEFSLSNGDNAGVAGGVKSSTFMKESTWILYSFDVKMDGSNACRLSDKKFQNHENTADLMGAVGPPVPLLFSQVEDALCQALCDHENGAQNGSNRRSSNDLEKQCKADPRFANVQFRTTFLNPPPPSGVPWLTKTTKPDAILSDHSQCYDFKLCGDRPRGDQVARQAAISGGNPPHIVSCDECINCNPSCSCP
jgi:Domain of unknown function (DUF4150)